MAEEEGFEPPRRFHALSVFKTDPFSRTWVFLHFIHILFGSGGGTRTPNLTGMNRTLQPVELLRLLLFAFNGREDRIRTCDPLVPNQVLYQAEPLPEFYGAPKRSRTPNLLIRSQTLYPIELWALFSWCLGPESNRHGCHHPQDFKSCASTSSATQAFHLFQGTRLFFKMVSCRGLEPLTL